MQSRFRAVRRAPNCPRYRTFSTPDREENGVRLRPMEARRRRGSANDRPSACAPPRRGGVLIYCSDFKCSHSVGRRRTLSDLEEKFVCTVCGKRGADVRPDFNWDKRGALTKSY
jgi:hypothetical protein